MTDSPVPRGAELRQRIGDELAAIGRAFASAVLWFVLISLAGGALIVAGVYVMAGAGPALIAAGIACLFCALFIRGGLTDVA